MHLIYYVSGVILWCLVTSSMNVLAQQHQQMMRPRVPVDKIEEARGLSTPFPPSQDIVEKGKLIYEGKGTCVNCHGRTGHGDGPGSVGLDPAPRVFRSRGFWRHRTEGEIFWVIKHGSPGTAMIPFGGLLSDEEIWQVIQYEQSFAGRGGGPGHRGRHHGQRGAKGRHGGRGRNGMMRNMMPDQPSSNKNECCRESQTFP